MLKDNENRSIVHQIKGFTMIEMVITLAVVAILAAVLIPLISQNITSARYARAGSDTATIGKAMVQFRQDTGRWPIYYNQQLMRLMFSDSDSNSDGVPDNSTVPSSWNTIPANQRLSLWFHLVNYNTTATHMGVAIQRGPSVNGLPAWNGPYLSGMQLDPWGNSYLVDSAGLDPSNPGIVFVLSPGPGRPAAVETPLNGVPPSGSDDIVFRLQ